MHKKIIMLLSIVCIGGAVAMQNDSFEDESFLQFLTGESDSFEQQDSQEFSFEINPEISGLIIENYNLDCENASYRNYIEQLRQLHNNENALKDKQINDLENYIHLLSSKIELLEKEKKDLEYQNKNLLFQMLGLNQDLRRKNKEIDLLKEVQSAQGKK